MLDLFFSGDGFAHEVSGGGCLTLSAFEDPGAVLTRGFDLHMGLVEGRVTGVSFFLALLLVLLVFLALLLVLLVLLLVAFVLVFVTLLLFTLLGALFVDPVDHALGLCLHESFGANEDADGRLSIVGLLHLEDFAHGLLTGHLVAGEVEAARDDDVGLSGNRVSNGDSSAVEGFDLGGSLGALVFPLVKVIVIKRKRGSNKTQQLHLLSSIPM